jgi:hypothetical protein
MTCIYCRADKPKELFNGREHVLPQSFGRFDGENLTLHDEVCDECNRFFANNLDIHLARDTYEGLQRVPQGIQKPEEYKNLGKRSTLVIQPQGGPFKNAYSYQRFDPDTGELKILPHPQIGFKLKGSNEREFFLVKDFPQKDDFDFSKYDLSGKDAFLIVEVETDTAKQLIASLGLNLRVGESVEHRSHDEETLDFSVTSTLTEPVSRCIAKISFNYLSVWCPTEVLLHDCFDPIREYVRYGVGSSNQFLSTVDRPILGDEPVEGWRRAVHLLTLYDVPEQGILIGQVSLINLMTYQVLLSRSVPPTQARLGIGHLFSLHSHKVSRLRPGETTLNP